MPLTLDLEARLDNLQTDDITKDFLIELFAFQNDKSKIYNPDEPYIVKAHKFNNDKPIESTIGRYIFNLFVLGNNIVNKIGYVNYQINKSKLEDLDDKVSEKLLNEEITMNDFKGYLDRLQWLSYAIVDFISPSASVDFVVIHPEIKKKKEELFKKYAKEIENADLAIANKIEKELIEFSKNLLKDNPSFSIYDSKAKISFDNHYKNMNLMKGAIRNNKTKKYKISLSNLTDGIDKDEYDLFADAAVYGQFFKSVSPRVSGYEAKKIFAAFQTSVLDEENTDCHTELFLRQEITEKNYKLFLYRYIIEGGKYKELTNENIKNYIGQEVRLRSPMFCNGKKICNICAGNLYYKLGIKNIGLTVSKMAGKLLNANMKAFHDSSVKTEKINFFNYIS